MTDSKKKRARRRFSDDFKREVVALYRSSGVSAAQVGEELGVSESLVYRWAREYSDEKMPAERPSSEELEKELRLTRRNWIF